MTFAEKLKELRKDSKVSQMTLHIETGIGNNTIQQYEKGTWLPLEDNCTKIATYFGIDANVLYREVDKERQYKNKGGK